MTSTQQRLLEFLTPHVRDAVTASTAMWNGCLHELRLHRGGRIAVVYHGRIVYPHGTCTSAEFDEMLFRFCGESLYAHSDTMRDGYIWTMDGFRIGVCGRAVLSGEHIERVTEITSMCIRVPSRVMGAADALLPYVYRDGRVMGALIWSPPGVGKTTALREIAALLSDERRALRCAVVDSRFEICQELDCGNLEVLRGYPRAAGMEIAVRTLSPDVLLCDEIADATDAAAVFRCAASGVAVIATAHAGSLSELRERKELRDLFCPHIFPTLAGLSRSGMTLRWEITDNPAEQEATG